MCRIGIVGEMGGPVARDQGKSVPMQRLVDQPPPLCGIFRGSRPAQERIGVPLILFALDQGSPVCRVPNTPR